MNNQLQFILSRQNIFSIWIAIKNVELQLNAYFRLKLAVQQPAALLHDFFFVVVALDAIVDCAEQINCIGKT